MLPYYIVFLFLFIGVIIEQISENELIKKRYLLLSIGILILFFGLRGYIGYDWYTYKPNFENISLLKIIKNSDYFEFGFKLYTAFIRNVFGSYAVYTFIGSLVDLLILYLVVRRYSDFPIASVLLFFCVYGLALEVDMLRNAKSIMLFLLSIKYIETRELKKFLALNILGFTFHASALIYLPMYFILNRRWNKKLILIIFLLGSFYYFSDVRIFLKLMKGIDLFIPTEFGKQIARKLSIYFSFASLNFPLGLSFFYVERLIIFILVWNISDVITEKKYGKIMLNSIYISIFIFLFLAEFSVVSTRISILFVYSYWFLLPVFFENYSKIFVYIVIFCISLFRINNQIGFDEGIGVYSYQNILINSQPVEVQRKKVQETFKLKNKAHGREISILF